VKILQRAARRRVLLGLGFALLLRHATLRQFADSMRDEINDIEPAHALLMEEVHCVRILFAINRH